jgi:hypothetical protein
MHMAVAQDYGDWLAKNAAYCWRLSANIAPTACRSARALSEGKGGDLRCEGCEGLHNQPERGATQLQLVPPSAATYNTAELDPFTVALLSILEGGQEEAEAGTEAVENELSFSDFCINEGDLDETMISQLSRELEDDSPWVVTSLKAYDVRIKTAPSRRYAVLQGRCRKCGGYMVSDLEGQFEQRDEDISRCYNCGLRTSPEYVFNRENPGATYQSHEVWRKY